MEIENVLANEVIGAAIKVHKQLGPGLLESAYQTCLAYELQKKGLKVESEKPLPVIYDEVHLEYGYRLDLLIENKLIIEIKSVESLNHVYLAQILTYLKLAECRLGLLLNFNTTLLKNGIKRVVNNL